MTTFLYVEDDILSVQVMELIIKKVLNFGDLIVLQDSEKFIKKVEALQTKPDLFMLDIHVRPHNGFELLKMLRDHPQFNNSRVIALTASVMGEEVDRLKASGFNGAIAKPLDIATFPALIKRVLDGESVWSVS